jgi:hypothetical protein
MTREYSNYLAEKFLKDYRNYPVQKRLVFDVWADGLRLKSDVKRQLWRDVKSLSRKKAA